MFGVKTRPVSASLTPLLLLLLVALASCGVGHTVGRGNIEQMQTRALSAEASATIALEREVDAIYDAAVLRQELADATSTIAARNAEIDLLDSMVVSLSKPTQAPETPVTFVVGGDTTRTTQPSLVKTWGSLDAKPTAER